MPKGAKAVGPAAMTFAETAATPGEEAAIEAGIAADPDTRGLTEEDFARMRPAGEARLRNVVTQRRTRGERTET